MSAQGGKIRCLVVDDSVVVRGVVAMILEEDPMLEIAGVAADGASAIAKAAQARPDLVILDIEMPGMSGLEALPIIRKIDPKIQVIIFSSLSARGASATLDALALGAADYVTKPTGGGLAGSKDRIRSELIPKIKAIFRRQSRSVSAVVPAIPLQPTTRALRPIAPRGVRRIEAVAIGASTGGPNALAQVLEATGDLPVPILVVQHMPPVFTRMLAERLSVKLGGRAREARDGEILAGHTVYVAPGDHHMAVVRDGERLLLRLSQTPPENFCRPAVDVLFRSLVAALGGNLLAVVLTGMGQDGFIGCEKIRAVGGEILVQDKASSVVWGMPGIVANAGLADAVLPLASMGAEIHRRATMRPFLRSAPHAAVGVRSADGG